MMSKAQKNWSKKVSLQKVHPNSWTSMHRSWDNYTRGPDHTYNPEPYFPDILPGILPKVKRSKETNPMQYMELLIRVARLEEMITKILDKLSKLENDVNPSVRGSIMLPIES